VSDLVDVLSRIHAERRLSFEIAVSASAIVGAEAQDLDEMLGNLLDNACKWARAAVRVTADRQGPSVAIIIEDDGEGIDPAEMPEALRPGRRLDEMTPGHGFGLPITRELAELYGGALSIGRSGLGGLSVTLKLPAPSG
jgi:signal transduction histidine kinase